MLFGEGTRAGNRQYLFRRIAWRLQALAEGDLTERARRRAQDSARDADLRPVPPPPTPHPDGRRGRELAMPPAPGELKTVAGGSQCRATTPADAGPNTHAPVQGAHVTR
jgi:hypothetical protein